MDKKLKAMAATWFRAAASAAVAPYRDWETTRSLKDGNNR